MFRMANHSLRAALISALAPAIAGCAINPQTNQPEVAPSIRTEFHSIFNSPNPCSNNDRNIGILTGAGIGILAAHLLGKHGRTLVAGGALGAVVGGLVGHSMDERRCKLYRIAQKYKLKLASTKITPNKLGVQPSPGEQATSTVGLDVQLENKDDEFVPGTAQLTPQGRKYLGTIAQQYAPQVVAASLGPTATAEQRAKIAQRHILIVGHTDERDKVPGGDLAKLSENRAKAVGEVFVAHGVPPQDIEYQGAGDALPIATNATAKGRAENNRVQIVDAPNLRMLAQYAAGRTADPADFVSARPHGKAVPNKQSEPAIVRQKYHRSHRTVHIEAARKRRHRPNLPATKTAAEASRSASRLGFQGKPLRANYRIYLGVSQVPHSMFSIIREAHAATPTWVGSCAQDHPRVISPIRNLATGRSLNINNSLPHLYGDPWSGRVGKVGVDLLHVYVSRDAGSPAPPVTVELYSRKDKTGTNSPMARFQNARVNVYRGSKYILYRVFLHGATQCFDLAVPPGSPSGYGLIVYPRDGREFGASGRFIAEE